ncbi:MAG: cadherin-like domain-containing protein, partial [Trueperaceae bacterium]
MKIGRLVAALVALLVVLVACLQSTPVPAPLEEPQEVGLSALGAPGSADTTELSSAIAALPEAVFAEKPGKNNGTRQADMLESVDAIQGFIESLRIDKAKAEAEDLRERVDGCESADEPDGDDWVTDCTAQNTLRTLIDELLADFIPDTDFSPLSEAIEALEDQQLHSPGKRSAMSAFVDQAEKATEDLRIDKAIEALEKLAEQVSCEPDALSLAMKKEPANGENDQGQDPDWVADPAARELICNLIDNTILSFFNEPPEAVDDAYATDEDTILSVDDPDLPPDTPGEPVGVLANDSDPDGDPLTITEVNGTSVTLPGTINLPSGAILTLNTDGTFSYDHNCQFEDLDAGDALVDSYDYTIDDGNGEIDTATVTIDVAGVNDPPVANQDDATTDEDTGTTVDVLANDTDVDGDDNPATFS